MNQKQLEKLGKRMGDELEPGERLVCGVTGQTGGSALLTAGVLGFVGFLTGQVRPRVVLASDRNVYVYSTVRKKGLKGKYPLGSVPVRLEGVGRLPALRVGEEKIWVSGWATTTGKANVQALVEHAGGQASPSEGEPPGSTGTGAVR